ncbi:MAG: hypothetical protein KF862_03390 [Chitinophagaceae bacterium]|nr:hypothetical protein [Chitinophagaceae bacterium]
MMEYNDHIDKDLFEKIEAYIHNRMDVNTRIAFEKEMGSDEALRNEVDLQRRLMASVEVFSHNRKEPVKSMTGQKAPVKKLNSTWLYAAAATVAIILVTWFFRSNTGKDEQLYASYFVPDAGLPVVMSGEHDRYDFYNGMVSYKEGEYSKAIEIWKNIALPSDTVSYFIGAANLNNENPAASTEYLVAVAQDDKSAWQSKAIWYLSLAYLKMNEKEKAIDWLSKLTNNEQAKQLIHDIQKTLP